MNKLLILFVTVAALWAPINFANAAVAQTDTQKLADIESAIKDLNRQLSDIKVQRSELEKQLERSEKNINDTMKHVEEIKAQIKAKEKQAGALSAGKKN